MGACKDLCTFFLDNDFYPFSIRLFRHVSIALSLSKFATILQQLVNLENVRILQLFPKSFYVHFEDNVRFSFFEYILSYYFMVLYELLLYIC